MATVSPEFRVVKHEVHQAEVDPRPLSQLFDEAARDCGERPFIVSRSVEGEDCSFAEFNRDAKAVARSLVADGIEPGDRVAILAEGRPRWCVAYGAILHAGGIVVPLDALLPAEGVLAALRNSEAKGLFVS